MLVWVVEPQVCVVLPPKRLALDHAPAGTGEVRTLKKVWSFDCDPTGPKGDIHPYSGNRKISPSNIYGMPVALDGRVYVAASGDFWILAAGREKKVLCETDLGAPISGTATCANGVVYVATMKQIWALK